MADYLPLYKPGQAITRSVSADVTGGQLVMVSGSGTVAPASASTPAWVGVAAFDAKTGDRVNVLKGGVQRVTASGAITAGDQVVAAANGQVSTLAAASGAVAADINNARSVVGTALSTAANGALVEVDFAR